MTNGNARVWRGDPDAEMIMREIAVLPYEIITINLADIDWEASANNCARLSDPLNKEKIEDYASGLDRGDVFPRIVVEATKLGKFIILGGNQRCAALKVVDLNGTIEAYCVAPLTTGERELMIRSLNSRHGWGATKEERVDHAAYLVREHGMHVDTVARAMVVAPSTIGLRIRAETQRAELAKKGIDASKVSRTALNAIASVKDQSLRMRVASLAVEKHATGDKVVELVSAITKAPSKSHAAAAIADFTKNAEAMAAINGKAKDQGKTLKKPRREKFLRLLTELSHFLETGKDGHSFATLDELSCSVALDLDNVRVLTAKITSRLQCICDAGK
jgi:hypothetical protein